MPHGLCFHWEIWYSIIWYHSVGLNLSPNFFLRIILFMHQQLKIKLVDESLMIDFDIPMHMYTWSQRCIFHQSKAFNELQ